MPPLPLPGRGRNYAGVSRRDLLRLGAVGCLGLSLPDLLRPQPAAAIRNPQSAIRNRAQACILLFMDGGPSHLDTWDPKPDAAVDYRGEFGAVATSVPGIRIGEHLPRLARVAAKYAIVRSVTSPEGSHERARQYMSTGRRGLPASEHPAYGVVVARERGPRLGLPPHVALPNPRAGDWSDSPQARRAFALGNEPAALRDEHGRSGFGQACLLARRLIEAGTRFVTVSRGGWDTHGQNFRQLRDQRLPELDAAFATLLRDLDDRGLLQETLVVWMGEFGRTPKINRTAGRDHWPWAQSVVFAGGGVRGGQVVGKTDSTASAPTERPVRPEDLAATIYHSLGIDPTRARTSPPGPPLPRSAGGAPLHELF